MPNPGEKAGWRSSQLYPGHVHLPGVPQDVHPGGVGGLHEGGNGEIVERDTLSVERRVAAAGQLKFPGKNGTELKG